MLSFKGKPHRHPSLWPVFALRSLVLWAAIVGLSFAAIYAIFGGPAPLLILAPVWAGLVVLALGVIPAAILAILDAAFVGRRHRSTRRHAEATHDHTPRAQSLTEWALAGAAIAAAVLAGYAVVYANIGRRDATLDELVGFSLSVGTITGLVAGWLTALILEAAHSVVPALTLTATVKRGAAIWMGVIGGFAAAASVLHAPALHETLLPAALVALIGGGVLPQVVARRPLNSTIPTAPPPSPQIPESGSGGGARGEWRSAPPPRVRQTTSTTTEVVNG